ncbi:class I SAM-dependent RNA methyltransferase [Carbonactinospora thermoautotrophica]|nr:class I SAM-dependent RNA methyltransferase [Carbonactinospora thermoautotrophica]
MCVARHEGRVVFVRHALPGERVRAVITEGRSSGRFLRADAIEILRPAPDRVTPPCPYAGPGKCGGCDWQHATPEAQRKLKAAVVAEQLRRLAGVKRKVYVEEVPGSPGGLDWRTRVQFSVDEEGRIGLRKHRSHEVVPIDRCLIAHPLIESLGIEKEIWTGVAGVEAIASASTGDRAVVVTPVEGARRVDVPDLAEDHALLERDPVKGRVRVVDGRDGVRERAAGREWQVSGSGFWQVHPKAPEILVEAVLDALDPQPGDTALDLYSGVGLFAGVIGQRVGPEGEVIAIEADPRAAADARYNLRDMPWITVERGRVERLLRRVDFGPKDLVALDPPRNGAGRSVVEEIVALEPQRVAYVACDPAALARDIGFFRDLGYELIDLRAFDLFPMTHHVECVATLEPID